MTTIYLIRHAEAEGNLYRIAQGQDNSILTDLGWQQIRALERRFADIPVDAVYASDLYRTCATASAIYRPKGLPLHRRRDLREICVGVWEQKTWGEIARRDPEQLEDFNRRLHLWHVEGAETPQAVQARMLAAVREIAAANDGRTVAVFFPRVRHPADAGSAAGDPAGGAGPDAHRQQHGGVSAAGGGSGHRGGLSGRRPPPDGSRLHPGTDAEKAGQRPGAGAVFRAAAAGADGVSRRLRRKDAGPAGRRRRADGISERDAGWSGGL